ncbi:MAG: DUF402 domain-containing protein [Nocardioidaceae bacterium]
MRIRYTKWGDRPHWELDGVLLGADEHGTWLGAPAGTRLRRPGVDFRAAYPQVMLVPDGRGFTATFYPPGFDTPRTYVDITTVPVIADGQVTMVDLDLDVVLGWGGRAWVDDEDEFADHRVRFGYPEDVVRLAARTCDELLAEVSAGLPPYDGAVAARWLAELDLVMMDR